MKLPKLPDAAWWKLHEWVLIGGAAGFLALAVWMLWPHRTPLPPAEQTTADSLKSTKPDFKARVDTLVKRETTYVAVSRQNRVESTETLRRADSLRRVAIVADSVARAERDTSSAWRAAADAWHRTADSLGAAVTHLEVAYSAESTARVSATVRADEFQRRNVSLEDFAGRLQKDLARADPPCRVALFLKCPSRKAVAVGSALVTLGAVYLVRHPSTIGLP